MGGMVKMKKIKKKINITYTHLFIIYLITSLIIGWIYSIIIPEKLLISIFISLISILVMILLMIYFCYVFKISSDALNKISSDALNYDNNKNEKNKGKMAKKKKKTNKNEI